MTARFLYQCFFALALIAAIAAPYHRAAFAQDDAKPQANHAKPNIVLVLSDDQTWHDAGCYGNDEIHTPHIDKLASQGMRFTHGFTATAMCAATRQQLYTGVFPVRNGAYPNHSRVRDGARSMAHHLQALGYRVGLIGKRHYKPAEAFPFEFLGGRHHDNGPRDGAEFDFDNARKFMQRDANQPYCLVVASNQPHLPWNRGDGSRYDPAKLTLPPYLVDTPETRQALANYYAEITYFDDQLGRVMKLIDATGKTEDTLLIYTSEQGAQFPRGKWTCYDTGLRTALIAHWPGRIKPGTVADAMVQYVDIAPTLIEAAGGDPRRIDTGLPGAPKHAGNPRGFDGRSFLAVLEGDAEKHHDFVFGCQTTRGIHSGSDAYAIRSIRTPTHKLIWNLNHDAAFKNLITERSGRKSYWTAWKEKAKTDDRAARFVRDYQHRPEFELYDLRDDAYELNNLAEKPELQSLKADLLARLKAWMKQQGDKGIETEMAARQRQGNG